MGSIQKTSTKYGNTRYVARIRKKGTPQRCTTFVLKADAAKWITLEESAISKERHFGIKESNDHTFSDLCEKYITQLSNMSVKKDGHIKIKISQLNEWEKRLGHLQLKEITPETISKERNAISFERDLSNSSVVRYLASLSSAFSFAIYELDWISSSPVTKVKRPKEPKGIDRCLSPSELESLLNESLKSKNPYLNAFVIIALSTGMRLSEITNLKWEDIDFERELLMLKDTKNNTSRSVHLSLESRSILKDMNTNTNTKLVFPSERSKWKNQEKKTCIVAAWKKVIKSSGIKDFRFHDLRHTCASYLAMNGASLIEISEILGHKSLKTTERYLYLCESHTNDVLRKMNEKFLTTKK